jgi:chemotaxis protein MotB
MKPRGKTVLKELAQVLRTLPNHSLQVAGHTDNVPVRSQRFPSNWSLSAQRAVEVVTLLVAQGVRPEMLVAAGYGEFVPIASNGSPEDKARNRRIEITVLPAAQSPRDLSQSTIIPKTSRR